MPQMKGSMASPPDGARADGRPVNQRGRSSAGLKTAEGRFGTDPTAASGPALPLPRPTNGEGAGPADAGVSARVSKRLSASFGGVNGRSDAAAGPRLGPLPIGAVASPKG
jgi:hypothetical protein